MTAKAGPSRAAALWEGAALHTPFPVLRSPVALPARRAALELAPPPPPATRAMQYMTFVKTRSGRGPSQSLGTRVDVIPGLGRLPPSVGQLCPRHWAEDGLSLYTRVFRLALAHISIPNLDQGLGDLDRVRPNSVKINLGRARPQIDQTWAELDRSWVGVDPGIGQSWAATGFGPTSTKCGSNSDVAPKAPMLARSGSKLGGCGTIGVGFGYYGAMTAHPARYSRPHPGRRNDEGTGTSIDQPRECALR